VPTFHGLTLLTKINNLSNSVGWVVETGCFENSLKRTPSLASHEARQGGMRSCFPCVSRSPTKTRFDFEGRTVQGIDERGAYSSFASVGATHFDLTIPLSIAQSAASDRPVFRTDQNSMPWLSGAAERRITSSRASRRWGGPFRAAGRFELGRAEERVGAAAFLLLRQAPVTIKLG